MTPPIAQLLALQAMDQYIWRKERDLLALDRQAVNLADLREQVEKEKEELQRAQDEKAALRVQVATETAQLRVQMAALHEEIQQKQRERERLAAGIDTPVLQEYERIFAWREGVAVVELYAQTCQGCHMRLPLQMCYEIQANPGLSSCPHCHRLLYWPSSEPSAIGPTPEALETNTQSKQRAARKAGKKAQARKGPRKDLPDNQQVHL